jgi:putative transcriptional regulator
MTIYINLDIMMAKRKIRLKTLSQLVGITEANLSILKNGKAKAVRLSTLDKLCEILACQPGDLFAFEKENDKSDKEVDPKIRTLL